MIDRRTMIAAGAAKPKMSTAFPRGFIWGASAAVDAAIARHNGLVSAA